MRGIPSFDRPTYPFSATVGHDEAKLALILNLVNPDIGGALLVGPKGSGKSLLVRGLAHLLPEIEVVDGCAFRCDPRNPATMCGECRAKRQQRRELPSKRVRMRIVELPLSATEDRLIGALDMERAIREGTRIIQPGLLAEANRGILHIDSVNLLQDHLTNAILDAAASGWNVVEREGASASHPSRFILIASMAPEEGGLRPQLLDRFALRVEIEAIKDPHSRAEVMKRNLEFDEDAATFMERYRGMQEELRRRINGARELLGDVLIPRRVFDAIAKICSELEVDGHRPDLVMVKAAKAYAALQGRRTVLPQDVYSITGLVLGHRTRQSGAEAPASIGEILRALKRAFKRAPARSKFAKLKMGPPPKTRMPKTRTSIKRRRVVKVPTTLLVLAIVALLAGLYYIGALTLLMTYDMIRGLPVGSFPTSRVFPVSLSLMALSSLAYLILRARSRRKERAIFYYGAKKPPAWVFTRRQLTKERSKGGGIVAKIVAAEGVHVMSAFKAALNVGRKVAKKIRQLIRPPKVKFKVSVRSKPARRRMVGRHVKSITTERRGRYVWHELPKDRIWDVAIAPTLRAAAMQQGRRRPSRFAIRVEPSDVRVKVREGRTPLSIIVLLDMSESMATSLDVVRDAITGLRKMAHRHRDRVGLVIFKGRSAEIIQRPTNNISLVMNKLMRVGASDFTPLAGGLLKAYEALIIEKRRNKDAIPVIVAITDGIVNVPLKRSLSPTSRKRLVNPAQADAFDAARRTAKSQVHTIIVNVDHRPFERMPTLAEEVKRLSLSPTEFLLELTRRLKGVYYGIGPKGKIESVVLTEAIAAAPVQVSPT